MPLQSTSGAASYDAFGGGAAAKVNYIEDFFQSYLRTGTGASATVTTGLDGSTKETLVWTKSRSAATNHKLTDNVRGATKALSSNTTGAEATDSQGLTAFSATGYTLGTNTDYNNSGATYVDWQWIAQPKFFDVVTYTGNNSSPRAIAHNLGSTPGCMIVKNTSTGGAWYVYHRSSAASGFTPQECILNLNNTNAVTDNTTFWASTAPTSTVFTVGSSLNSNGETYVAYLFAHNAGGFGLTGTDNVISCGSYTGVGGGNVATITLGYEPQWILVKRTDNSAGGNWAIFDNMRGMSVNSTDNASMLNPNLIDAESVLSAFKPTATGFQTGDNFTASGGTYIYIAIRRGPMKVPTSGTSVYNNLANRVGTSATATISGVGFPVDLMLPFNETSGSVKPFVDRLRGATKYLLPPYSNAEQTETNVVTSFASNDGVIVGADSLDVINNYYNASRRYAASFFRRAPSFFDEVCYTGTGAANTAFTHNLTVTPELMIVKPRSAATAPNWRVWSPINSTDFNLLQLSTDGAASSSLYSSSNVFPAIPTATTFTVGGSGSIQLNESGQTFVAYLFATCAGVSKCGTFTGNGSSQTINCGFTGGARFILIKRTDSTGDWYMYDSARGISASSDPYLLLNTTGASELGTNYVDTDSTGFKVTAAAPAALNANGGSFIFLAIA